MFAPYLLNPLKDFHETFVKCLPLRFVCVWGVGVGGGGGGGGLYTICSSAILSNTSSVLSQSLALTDPWVLNFPPCRGPGG